MLRRVFPNPGYYGWSIVVLTFLASALSSPGQSFGISLYVEEIITSLDVSRMEVSSLYGTMTFLAALCLPWVGAIADRTPSRTFITINIVLLAVAMSFLGAAQNLVMLGIGFFLLRVLGQGAIGLGTLTTIVFWFKTYRGRALSMSALGFAFGELVFPATSIHLTQWVGWRGSLWIMAAFYVVVFAPIFWSFVRARRDDEPLDGSDLAAPSGSGKTVTDADFDVHTAVRTPVFWGLLGTVAVLPMVITALIFHQISLFKATGWGAQLIPTAFVFFALSSVTTNYTTGFLLEKYPSRFGVSIGMLAATAAIAIAMTSTSPYSAYAYGAVLGASSGILTASNAMIWPEYFGIRALGAIKGVVNGFRNGATAIGPPLVAFLIGTGEDFSKALPVLAAFCVFSAMAAPFMKPPNSWPDTLSRAHLQNRLT